MCNNNVIFKIDDHERIVIELNSIEQVFYYDEVQIKWFGSQSFLLTDDCLLYLVRQFKGMLLWALNNELQLDESIQENLGYMWNRLLHGDSGFKYKDEFWVGLNYSLWETPGNVNPVLTTWIYNDIKGNIILEIAPDYRWHHMDPKPGEKFISYEEFMKNYKPYIVRIIPKNVATRWLAQAEHLLQTIEENQKMVCGQDTA